MSNAVKQVAHYTPPFEVLTHPSVFVCKPGSVWNEGLLLAGKTMSVHPTSVNQGGSLWKCSVCGRTFTSA